MLKRVLLSPGMTGQTHELKVDKTTIGRLEDNSFQIPEPSVSSHHCEVLLRGQDVIVHDLNSTNGTFINGEKVSESPIKPGQILRLGQIEMRLETDGPPAAPKKVDQTLVMQRGVSLNELEQGTRGGFDTSSKGFSKKDNKVNTIVWISAGVIGLVILALLLFKATENFKLGVVAATGGIALVYLASMVLRFFNMEIPLIHESGIVGIGFSLLVVVIAALNLVLDFDFIESGVEHGAPKYMEWYGAFGLMVTLVWLYIEFLRLLEKLRD